MEPITLGEFIVRSRFPNAECRTADERGMYHNIYTDHGFVRIGGHIFMSEAWEFCGRIVHANATNPERRSLPAHR